MKNIVRVFVLSLVVTGAYASAYTSNATEPALHTKISAIPVPMCPPGDPNGCNICNINGCAPGVN